MSNSIDEVSNLTVKIFRGAPGWVIGFATRVDGASNESDVLVGEVKSGDFPTTRSLVETEIMLTAWLTGRGFVIQSHWRTYELDSESRPAYIRAEFIRQ